MRRWRNFFWITAGLLVLIGLAGSITPYAVAQVRAALVRDLDSPIRGERFALQFNDIFSSSSFFSTTVSTPSIPTGKKLLVQSIDIHLSLNETQSPMEARATLPSGAMYWFDMNFQAASSIQRHFTGSREVNTVMLPGEPIVIFVVRNDAGGTSSFYTVSVTGYLVDQNP